MNPITEAEEKFSLYKKNLFSFSHISWSRRHLQIKYEHMRLFDPYSMRGLYYLIRYSIICFTVPSTRDAWSFLILFDPCRVLDSLIGQMPRSHLHMIASQASNASSPVQGYIYFRKGNQPFAIKHLELVYIGLGLTTVSCPLSYTHYRGCLPYPKLSPARRAQMVLVRAPKSASD